MRKAAANKQKNLMSMTHELLTAEEEILLGRQIQLLIKWEAIRLELEEDKG